MPMKWGFGNATISRMNMAEGESKANATIASDKRGKEYMLIWMSKYNS